MAGILHVKTQEFKDVIANNDIVFVDFYADWCGPCKMLAPSVDKLAQEHPEVQVVKVNTDDEAQLAMDYQVQSIPTLMVFKKGELVERQLGFVPYATIENMIK